MSMSGHWVVCGGDIVLEDGLVHDGAVVVVHGRIAWVGRRIEMPRRIDNPAASGTVRVGELPELHVGGRLIAPGMIDLHVHGGGGADVMEGTLDALATVAATHAAHGTTSLLATTLTAPEDDLLRIARLMPDAARASDSQLWRGARILGLHLEGPYIHPERAGAQNPAHIRPPNPSEMKRLLDAAGGYMRLVTLAPELPGAAPLIAMLRQASVAVALGHTTATYEDAVRAVELGVRHAAHIFNAMTGLQAREPGAVGAVLLDPRVRAEVIADMHHVHPAVLRLLVQLKGPAGVCLITDAIAAMGQGDGWSSLGGMPVRVKDGVCRLESGALAGSVLSMERALANMVHEVGVPLTDAVVMASRTPAASIGAHHVGAIAPGRLADLIVLDEELRCRLTLVAGRIVHER